MILNEGFKIIGTIPTEKGEISLSLAAGIPTIEKVKGSFLIQVQPKTAEMPIKGYTFPNSKIQKIVEKAIENNSYLLLRFEKQRKKNIDKNIPLVELAPPGDIRTARKNIFNSCVGVYDINKNEWILDGGYSDPANDNEEVAKFINYVTSYKEVNVDDFFKEKTIPIKQLTAPNPITFDKQQCILSLYFWLKDCEIKNNFNLTEEARRMTTIKLLKLTDKLYAMLKGNDEIKVNYGDYAHTRSRFMLFRYGECNELLNEEAVKDINNWLKNCYLFYTDLIEWINQ